MEREIAGEHPGAEVELSEEYTRRGRTEGILGGVTGLLVVVVIFLMVTKPGV